MFRAACALSRCRTRHAHADASDTHLLLMTTRSLCALANTSAADTSASLATATAKGGTLPSSHGLAGSKQQSPVTGSCSRFGDCIAPGCAARQNDELKLLTPASQAAGSYAGGKQSASGGDTWMSLPATDALKAAHSEGVGQQVCPGRHDGGSAGGAGTPLGGAGARGTRASASLGRGRDSRVYGCGTVTARAPAASAATRSATRAIRRPKFAVRTMGLPSRRARR